MRIYTALKDGVVIQQGTFECEIFLHQIFPEPEYSLVLDAHLPFPKQQPTYQEQRRMAYPPLSEFADAMFWQSQGDDAKMDAYLERVAAVKAQFPKSN